jgi:hypothetical protein
LPSEYGNLTEYVEAEEAVQQTTQQYKLECIYPQVDHGIDDAHYGLSPEQKMNDVSVTTTSLLTLKHDHFILNPHPLKTCTSI